MSKLNVDQKSVKDLFQNKHADFLIPDYQRPYAWGETECQTLWDDIFGFAFPDNDCNKFDRNNEYFLGPIVTFKNDGGKMEVIDGQQRLTTLMLLLRAFYVCFINMQDEYSRSTREELGKCIWKTDEFGRPDMNALKIDSEVASDNDKEEFLEILRTGSVEKGHKSRYAVNYKFFQGKIEDFLKSFPAYCNYMPIRILNNCILLPIEAESQDTALRIFSTLNDRGKPLSDADIFKAQFYKNYSKLGQKDEFTRRWKDLDELCQEIFHPLSGTPMDELFSRYMYYIRAKQGIKASTVEALRKFYERDGYALLKRPETLDEMEILARFWKDVSIQENSRFSDQVLRQLYILNWAPNSMWTYFVSVYFLQNRQEDGALDDQAFYDFLKKTIAFIWTYAVTNPGVNTLRAPVFAEMVNIVTGKPVTFGAYQFDSKAVKNRFFTVEFGNNRPITKAMLAWWAFQDKEQPLLDLNKEFDIEHIFARNRQEKEESLSDSKLLEVLGNKALLERRINISASDYRFADKKKYYLGFTQRGRKKERTKIHELEQLANTASDFTEADIVRRNEQIINQFIDFLRENELTADSSHGHTA